MGWESSSSSLVYTFWHRIEWHCKFPSFNIINFGKNFFQAMCIKNRYFLHWNFDWKSCFVVFFLEWNKWKNPQFNFLSQNLSIECNFFKWEWKKHFKGFPPFFLAHFVNEHLHFSSFYFMYTVNFFSSQSFSICQYWYTPIII